jgi:alkylhydroperoxidase/carboxymuconolactone decarboxylase family protein YurZ
MSSAPVVDSEDIVARVARERGVSREWHKIVARYDPGMLQRHHENVVAVMNLPALSKREKELIIVAVDAATSVPGIWVHIRGALREGATEAQVAEAILTAGVPAGPHAVSFGMEQLDATLKQMAAESNQAAQQPAG